MTEQLFDVASSTGASFFHVNSGGNIGIGTSSPFSLLSVINLASSTSNNLFYLGSTTNVSGNYSTTTIFDISNTGAFTFGSASTTLNFTGATTTFDFRTSLGTTTFLIANATSSFMIGTSTDGGTGAITNSSASAVISISGNQGTSTISFFGATTTLLSGLGAATPTTGPFAASAAMKNALIIGNGKTNAAVAVVNGALCVDNDGWCNATTTGQISSRSSQLTRGSDIAEMYPSDGEDMPAGTIVRSVSGNVVGLASTTTSVIGIISTQPALTVGDQSASREDWGGQVAVALAGRVPVKVNLDNGPVASGDRIALSTSTPGVGMKAGPFDPTVAIALEPFASTTATTTSILSFVSLNKGTDVATLAQALASSTATTSAQALIAGPYAASSLTLQQAITSALGAIANIAQAGVRELGLAVHASVGVFDKLFAQTIVVDDLTAQTITAQQKLCVGGTCLTESQLQSLLGGSSGGSGGGSSPPPPAPPPPSGDSGTSTSPSGGSGTSTTDTTPPTVTLNGNNPDTVNVGDTYTDAGATVTDNVDTNLTYTVSVDGGAAAAGPAVIDTSAAGTHSIIYSATDTAGNTGTATRTVDVVDPLAGQANASSTTP